MSSTIRLTRDQPGAAHELLLRASQGQRQQIARRAAKSETPYTIAKALGIDRHTVAKYAT